MKRFSAEEYGEVSAQDNFEWCRGEGSGMGYASGEALARITCASIFMSYPNWNKRALKYREDFANRVKVAFDRKWKELWAEVSEPEKV